MRVILPGSLFGLSLSPIFKLIVGLLTLAPFNLSIPVSILSSIFVREILNPAEAIASNLFEASTVLIIFSDLPTGICNSFKPTIFTFTFTSLK